MKFLAIVIGFTVGAMYLPYPYNGFWILAALVIITLGLLSMAFRGLRGIADRLGGRTEYHYHEASKDPTAPDDTISVNYRRVNR